MSQNQAFSHPLNPEKTPSRQGVDNLKVEALHISENESDNHQNSTKMEANTNNLARELNFLPGENIILNMKVQSFDFSNKSSSGFFVLDENFGSSFLKIDESSQEDQDDDKSSSFIDTKVEYHCVMTFYRLLFYCDYYCCSSSDRSSNNSVSHLSLVSQGSLSRSWQLLRLNEKSCHGDDNHDNIIKKRRVYEMPLGCIDTIQRLSSTTPSTFTTNYNNLSTTVSVSSIHQSLKRSANSNNNSSNASLTIQVKAKDHRGFVRFTTESLQDCLRAHETLVTYAHPGRVYLGYLFAFECRREQGTNKSQIGTGKMWYDVEREFERQGCLKTRYFNSAAVEVTSPWRLTRANHNYAVCSSYPSHIVVPVNAVEDSTIIIKTAKFRSEGRLPAMSWGSRVDAASIWRCSQPKVGLQGNRSSADEAYLKAVAGAYQKFSKIGGGQKIIPEEYKQLINWNDDPQSSAAENGLCQLKILDLRPKAAAMANKTQGYGYEGSSNYPFASLEFCNIGNIHSVRDAFQKLLSLCLSTTTNDINWGGLVEDTKWLSLNRYILSAAWECAVTVHYKRIPVLLHCSHGWDRTSQVSALAQLFLDPYFRTFDGFIALIEKDFLSFGHPFHLRAAHGETCGDSPTSPVFLQFLDCVHQIQRQYPAFFEFNSKFLLLIAEHIYDCRFGTLLCDTERDRKAARLQERTFSLWDYLDSLRVHLMNTFYCEKGVLIPSLSTLLRGVRLWSDYFLKFSAKASQSCIPHNLAAAYNNADERVDASMDQNDYTNALLKVTLDSAMKYRQDLLQAKMANEPQSTDPLCIKEANGIVQKCVEGDRTHKENDIIKLKQEVERLQYRIWELEQEENSKKENGTK